MIVLPIYFLLSFSPMKVIIYTPYNNGVQNSDFKCSCFIKSSYQPFLIRKIALKRLTVSNIIFRMFCCKEGHRQLTE